MKHWILAIPLLAIGAAPSPGETIDTASPAPIEEISPSLTTSNGWHAWHRRWSSNVINTAEYIDNFFADPRLDKESNGSRLKLSLGTEYKDGEGFSFITRANVRLSLPRTSKRLKIFFEDIVESDDPASANQALRDMRDSNPDTGLRYSIRQKRRYSIDLDGGYRTSSDQFFGRIRGKRDFFATEQLKFRLTQSASYYTEDEWISKTEFDASYQLPHDYLFRSESELECAEDIEGVRPAQMFILFKPLSKHRAVRYEIGGDWPESPGPTETKYFTSFTFRSLIHSDWIYVELEPGVEFAQVNDYEPKGFVMLKFDIVFGKMD